MTVLFLGLFLAACAAPDPPAGFPGDAPVGRDAAVAGRVHGRVQASDGSGPIPRVWVQVTPGQMAFTDDAGVFDLRGLSGDSVRLLVRCRMATRPRMATYGPFRTPVGGADPAVLELLPGSCEVPGGPDPVRELEGHYSGGFEESRFVPCGGSPDPPGGGFEPIGRDPWVERFPDENGPVAWPPAGEAVDPWGYPRHFLRLRGTLVGPGRFGHLGVSPFLLAVDAVLEARAAADGDCGTPS